MREVSQRGKYKLYYLEATEPFPGWGKRPVGATGHWGGIFPEESTTPGCISCRSIIFFGKSWETATKKWREKLEEME